MTHWHLLSHRFELLALCLKIGFFLPFFSMLLFYLFFTTENTVLWMKTVGNNPHFQCSLRSCSVCMHYFTGFHPITRFTRYFGPELARLWLCFVFSVHLCKLNWQSSPKAHTVQTDNCQTHRLSSECLQRYQMSVWFWVDVYKRIKLNTWKAENCGNSSLYISVSEKHKADKWGIKVETDVEWL